MEEPEKNVYVRVIEDEMKQAYMSYAMSVIVGRALPDARDGLKPVHRRILYAMNDMGMQHNKPFKKCARIVGEVLGKYHPHGDTAVYDSLVRMAQDFSLRYPLIFGQGNFGSIDGDSAAAMRYTEAKLAKISEELLKDLEKETVDWTDNFDASLKEPWVLPSVLPNLLVNGSSGIAVGMATNIPPHNLKEICSAAKELIDNPEMTAKELMRHVKGPDFPTGGVICGTAGIVEAYKSGRGKIIVRGVLEQEEHKGHPRFVITEIPYQVVKADLIEYIAMLVHDKVIDGITDIRDESDRRGMRVVIELRKDANPDVIENQLFKYTKLQSTFSITNLALVDNQPRVMSLAQLLTHFLEHRKEVITRRTKYDLRKAQERAHILEGLLVALDDIDKIITLIKKSKDAPAAKDGLMTAYPLSEIQANAILEMRLQRLTSLEQGKIRDEHKELLVTIGDLQDILRKPERVKMIIKDELDNLSTTYGDERKTRFAEELKDIEAEDLIMSEEMVVTISHKGYIKRCGLDSYQMQRRGGVGVRGATTKEDDFVEHLFVANTHSYLLFITSNGRANWLKVYKIPEAGRTAKGVALANLLRLRKEESISAVIPVQEFRKDRYVFFATKKGVIKKTSLDAFSRPRAGGIHAINLVGGDRVVNAVLTEGTSKIMLASAKGMAERFDESDVRPMGRSSAGVRGMALKQGDKVISLAIADEKQTVLTITQNGYGKRSRVEDYRLTKRGGYGVRNILTTERNGDAVAVTIVHDSDDLFMISQKGVMLRTSAKGISVFGRSTQGVRVMKLRAGDKVSSVAKVYSNGAR